MTCRRRHRWTAPVILLVTGPWILGCGDDAEAGVSEEAGIDAQTAAAVTSKDVPPKTETPAASMDEAAPEDRVTLANAFASDPELTVFGLVLEESRLGPELEGEAITIFAPTNAAFSTLGDTRLAGEANARSFVLRHAATGALDREALEELTEIRPREGRWLAIDSEGDALRVGPAEILRTLRVGDATIHVVSRAIEIEG
jgi:uncharacterized surface protein with fasciclin (FAS1) repeats